VMFEGCLLFFIYAINPMFGSCLQDMLFAFMQGSADLDLG